MLKNTLIIALLIALIYLYYQQNKKTDFSTKITGFDNELDELKKRLDKIVEQNEDYETEVDTLTRTKNSLEADLLAQSNAFQSRLKEKDRENKKLKEDLTSEKQQHKGSLQRITKLTEQITNLEQQVQRTKSPLPGEFPQEDLTKTHQEQLRKINSLFDEKANNYPQIDFNGLYALLETIAEEAKKKRIKNNPDD